MDLFSQITRTKILIPGRRSDLLSRERLLNALYVLLDRRLTIIAAPAGYGKTSLMIDAAHNLDLPFCWYALDSFDQDPQRFINHFIASIAHRYPDFGRRSFVTLQNAKMDEAGLNQIVTTLINEIYDVIPEYFVVVLDDYHLINDNESIAYFLNRFIHQVSENFHLIIASRTLINLPDLPLLVARAQVGGLSFDELAFQTEEFQWLALQNYHLTLSEVEAESLVRETEGWITGIMLSAQMKQQGLTDPLRMARSAGVGLYDYLAQQVFDLQPADIQEFLLHTSLLEEFDVSLCEAVLGTEQDWGALMQALIQKNLFVLPVDSEGLWLRYHHLFQDFLQTRLKKVDRETYDCLQRRLADVCIEREQWEKTYNIYQRLADLDGIVSLIEQVGLTLIRDGRWVILAHWINNLPSQKIETRPFVLSLQGYMTLLEAKDMKQGVLLLNQSERFCRKINDKATLARTLSWRAMLYYYSADYRKSLIDANEVISLAEYDETLIVVYAEALRARGLSLYRLGEFRQAIKSLEHSLTICRKIDDPKTSAVILIDLGLVYMDTGDYAFAEAEYNAALIYWRDIGNITAQASLLNNMGVLQHLMGNYENAAKHLENALSYAQQSGLTRVESLALTGIGDLYADLGASEVAWKTYSQAYDIAQRIDYRFLLFYLNMAQAALARSEGNDEQSQQFLDVAKQFIQTSDSDYQLGLYHLGVGQLALTRNDGEKAVRHFVQAINDFSESQRLERSSTYFWLAMAYHKIKQERESLVYVTQALRLISNLECWHKLVTIGQDAKLLLEVAKKEKGLSVLAERLLKQIIKFEQSIPVLQRQLRRQSSTILFVQAKLSIRALGKSEVELDGQILANTAWEARVARDLFFCLLAHPAGLSKEAIGLIFWPDYTAAQLKLQFKSTIYRLRRAVGSEMILHYTDTDRYGFNWESDYEYDVEAFWGKIAQVEVTTGHIERIQLYQQIVDLYGGTYLPEVEGTWLWSERERLAQAFEEIVLDLAELYLETMDYEAVVAQCQRALRYDSCLEPAYRLGMRAYAGMGNRPAIIRQFDQCREVLQAELGVKPSPQTERLYQTLIR